MGTVRPSQKALSAYALYVQDYSAKNKGEDGSKVKDLMKVAGAAWKELSDEEKQPFEEQSKKQHEDFAVSMAKYMEEHPDYKLDLRGPPPQPPAPFVGSAP